MAKNTETPSSETLVVMAKIGAPHGLRGEMKLQAFTDDPLSLDDYDRFYLPEGRTIAIKTLRGTNKGLIVTFDGVTDRTGAEALTNLTLSVPRSQLPNVSEEDGFYHIDLVGLTAHDTEGQSFGHIVAVHNFGAGDILELKPKSGPTFMVPFTLSAVPNVDLGKKMLVIDQAAAGLLDNGESETDEDEAR